MRLKEIMTPGVAKISPDATLQVAAEQMRSNDIGALPVFLADRIIGMLTDRDIAIRSVAAGCDPNLAKVSDAMSPGITWCFDDDDVEGAAALMEKQQIRRLLVIDHSREIVGIVTLGDVARHSHNHVLSGEILKHVSMPSNQNGYSSPM